MSRRSARAKYIIRDVVDRRRTTDGEDEGRLEYRAFCALEGAEDDEEFAYEWCVKHPAFSRPPARPLQPLCTHTRQTSPDTRILTDTHVFLASDRRVETDSLLSVGCANMWACAGVRGRAWMHVLMVRCRQVPPGLLEKLPARESCGWWCRR